MAALPPSIRINLQAPFPALVMGSGPIVLSKQNGIWTVALDVNDLAAQAPPPGNYATDYLLMWDSVAKTYFKISLTTVQGVVAGVARTQRSVIASPIVVAANDQILNVNINSGPATCALPAAATRAGVPLTFKDVGAQFGANNLTITPNGVETIDGGANLVLKTNHQGVTLVQFNDGVNTGWSIQ